MPTANPKVCVSGAAKGSRCEKPAVAGFDYCDGCSRFLGGYLIQLPPGDPERDQMRGERTADKAAAARADRPKPKRAKK